MLEKITQSKEFNRIKRKVKDGSKRLMDQNVSLAVTGLSRSGKTAFITSLTNQLLTSSANHGLPFWRSHAQGRVIGVKRLPQPSPLVKRFAYDEGIDGLTQESPVWPASTNGISQIRLAIKYRTQSSLRRLAKEDATLILDITDYPGEWLLDLPLLSLDYSQWSAVCEGELELKPRRFFARNFIEHIEKLDLNAQVDEQVVQSISLKYQDYLRQCKEDGFQLIQPGRFVLPGDLKDAPVLHFFPIPASLQQQDVNWQQPVEGSYAASLVKGFEQYKKHVVQPFYEDHFKQFDRQVVLVDMLSALNQGAHAFDELQTCINWILKNFQYGQSSILRRIFSPKIDKLIFAASKADHITPDQHDNLVKLLDSFVYEQRQHTEFDGVSTECTALSAIKTSDVARVKHKGKEMTVLKGNNVQGEPITLYPGDVPQTKPSSEVWQQHTFSFNEFSPKKVIPNQGIDHIRMDQVIEFILGDKME